MKVDVCPIFFLIETYSSNILSGRGAGASLRLMRICV